MHSGALPALLALLTATPTHAPSPPSDQGSSIQPWLVAIFGASLASLLAIIGYFCRDFLNSHKDLAYLRRTVQKEIASIGDLCRQRENLPAERIVIVPPFPVSAWDTLCLSSHRFRISSGEADSWEGLYRTVKMANAVFAIVPYFLQISALAADEREREKSRQEAIKLTLEQLSHIRKALPRVSNATTSEKLHECSRVAVVGRNRSA
jgi:hypothetical protein